MTLATLQPAAPAPVALPAQKYVLAIQRPFVDMALLQFVLDISEDQALWLIEEGSIAFAFNLKTKKARLPYLRILTQSVLDHVNRQSSLGEDAELKRHLECIFPPTVNPTAQALASTFTCGSTHIIDLMNEGALAFAGGAWRQGRGGSPKVKRESVISFLTERRVI